MHSLFPLPLLPLLPLLTLLTLATLSLSSTPTCLSHTLSLHTLLRTPLSLLNPHLLTSPFYRTLLASGCPTPRASAAVCPDLPALGSGLAQLSPRVFLALSDRGPTQHCEHLFAADPQLYAHAKGNTGTAFPLPDFAPSLAVLVADNHSTELSVAHVVPLRGRRGRLITGLPNTERDDVPYGPGCKGPRLQFRKGGLDPEDVAVIPHTDFVAIVEEYSPSVVIANYKTGRIAARHVPRQLKRELSGAGYNVVPDLPDVFAERRRNRGFEGVVVDAEGKYVIAIVQSPMLGHDELATENNAVIRCAYFEMLPPRGKGSRAAPRLRYKRSFVIEASPVGAYLDNSNRPKDIKYSAAQYAAPGKFVALERAKGQVKLFLIDFSRATNVDETKYADDLALERETNGVLRPQQLGVVPAEKTLIWDSAPGVGGTVGFDGSDKQEGFAIDMDDPTKLWIVDDNDFGLGGKGAMQLRQIALGRSVSGATVCGMPDHPPSPRIDVEPSKAIRLTNPSTFRVLDEPGKNGAENLDIDEVAARAYVVNCEAKSVDMYDVSTTAPSPLASYVPGGPYTPTSVAVCRGRDLIAVGLANVEDEAAPGRIDILDKDLVVFRKIQEEGCVFVDNVEWSPDCNYVLGACEGEGKDIPGGVLVADFGGPGGNPFRGASVADFKGFDPLSSVLKENGVHLVESDVASVDLEPEYITIVGKHAFVTIQEANAIAVVDIFEAKVTELKPIGFIDRSRPGFGLDASDKDDAINIRNYPFLLGMPQPDTISKYVAEDGKTYLVFANEGDSKEDEEARGEDIIDPDELGRIAVPGLKQLVADETLLGRLKFSTVMGYNESTNTQEKMFHFGSRSFAIMALDGRIVFDSGEWFARIQEKHFLEIFNSQGYDNGDLSLSQEDLFDTRSDDKGSEPESLSLMTKDGKTYAFVGLERPSIIVVFDITIPTSPIFVDAVQNHPFNEPAEKVFAEGRQGDIDPEGLFASAGLGKLFVSGSASSTVSSYDIEM